MRADLPFFMLIDELWLALAAGLAFGGIIWISYLAGRRTFMSDAAKSQVGSLQAASLGLLALLLGFSFAMAGNRYDTRRRVVVDEANAIGTTILRAQTMPEPFRTRLAGLLKEYVDRRVEFYASGREIGIAIEAELKTISLQSEIWNQTVEITKVSQTPVVAAFILTVNQMIDLQAVRLAAIEDHVPPPVLWLLLIAGVGAMGITGFASGLTGLRSVLPLATAAVMVVLVIYVILDMDRPRVGMVSIGQNSMLRLQASLKAPPPATAPSAPATSAPPAVAR